MKQKNETSLSLRYLALVAAAFAPSLSGCLGSLHTEGVIDYEGSPQQELPKDEQSLETSSDGESKDSSSVA